MHILRPPKRMPNQTRRHRGVAELIYQNEHAQGTRLPITIETTQPVD